MLDNTQILFFSPEIQLPLHKNVWLTSYPFALWQFNC